MKDNEQFQSPKPEQILYPKENSREVHAPSTQPLAGLQKGLGLAVASLVLGIVSLPLAFFVVGAGAGLVGLILAIIHLSKRLPLRAMAAWGLALSALGLVAGMGFCVLYGIGFYQTYSMMQQWEDVQFEEYIGTEMPDMTLTDLDGNEIKLSDLKGKRLVLDFWATWCPPCKKEIPHFIKLRQITDPDELVIIGISNESANVIRPFAEKYNINYPLVSLPDEELPEPYSEIISIPTTFFIDSRGLLQDVLTGYHSFKDLKNSALASEEEMNESSTDVSSSD